jgi:hypothetical protein
MKVAVLQSHLLPLSDSPHYKLPLFLPRTLTSPGRWHTIDRLIISSPRCPSTDVYTYAWPPPGSPRCLSTDVCECVRMCARVCACVRVRACVRVFVCVRVSECVL